MTQDSPPVWQQPYILIVPESSSQHVQQMRDSLQRAGWDVVISSDLLLYLPQASACIVVLSPETINDPAVRGAMNSGGRMLIPVMTEPMSIPQGRWTAAAIVLSVVGGIAAATSILQILSETLSVQSPPQPVGQIPSSQPSMPYQPVGPMPVAPYQPSSSPYPIGYPTSYPPAPNVDSTTSTVAQAAARGAGALAPWVRMALIISTIVVIGVAAVVIVQQNHPFIPGFTSVAGKWSIALTFQGNAGGSPVSGASQGTLTLQQNGSNLTGTLTDQQGNGVALSGSLNGHSITLDGTYSNGESTAMYHLTGTVSGDFKSMSGDATYQVNILGTNESFSGTWTATRTSS